MSRNSRPSFVDPKLEQAVRAAAPVAALRELVHRTAGLGATVQLGTDADGRIGLVELLKLGNVEPAFVVTSNLIEGQSTAELTGPEGSTELSPHDLDNPLGPSFVEALADVTGWPHVAALAFALAGEARTLRREVEDLTRQDEPTGLLNRRELEARLAHERSRVVRERGALSVLLIEADEPDAPDAAPRSRLAVEHTPAVARLRSAAHVLKSELRAHDVAARFDDGLIAVLLPGAGSLEVALVAKRIGQAALRRGTSLSIGGSSFPDDSDHPDDLFQLATKSLEDARAAGRGRACLCGAEEAILFDEDATV